MTFDPVERLAVVDSTNAEALRRAQAGARGPLWILADTQTAGRGRSGRSWSSETGNLHASLLFTLTLPQPMAYQLALVAGVAVFDALQGALHPAPAGLRLKWPNDILIGDAKTGGILIESSVAGGTLVAVVGIGLNVAAAPHLPDRATTHLAAHGVPPAPRLLLDAIAEPMRIWLAAWDQGRGFPAVREAWLNRALPIGERLSINTGSDCALGTFAGLDPEGALLLESGGNVRRFTFGDVSLAR